jgi:hypothetical protein
MTKTIQYIASGTAYLKLNSSNNYDNERNSKYISKLFEKIATESKYHDFGLLFNAFTESKFGANFPKYSGIHSVHSDSGGLQIVTQGKTVDLEIKDKIYKTQANYSDFAMCFDEIPIGKLGNTSGRNDVDNRWFDSEKLEYYARLTGKNIKRQIEIFKEEKTNAKPILIAQGNCYDSYMRWVEYILDELSEEDIECIGAVAMGAAALGTGTLEDIERAFYFKQLPLKSNHLHVLGVGSAKRMLPYINFIQNGLYDGVSVSYDSTTHTSGSELGLFYSKDGTQISFNRSMSKLYENMLEDISEFAEMKDIDVKLYHQIMNTGYTKYTETVNSDDFDFLRVRMGHVTKSISNFTKHIDRLIDSTDEILKVAQIAKVYNPIKHLYNVRTKDDFDYWYTHLGRRVKSTRVAANQPTNLNGFFE